MPNKMAQELGLLKQPSPEKSIRHASSATPNASKNTKKYYDGVGQFLKLATKDLTRFRFSFLNHWCEERHDKTVQLYKKKSSQEKERQGLEVLCMGLLNISWSLAIDSSGREPTSVGRNVQKSMP